MHAALVGAQAGFALFPILGKIVLADPGLPVRGSQGHGRGAPARAPPPDAPARAPPPRDRKRLFLYGLLGVSFNQVLFILGLSLTSAINTTILTATIPVFTLAAAVGLGRERLTSRPALRHRARGLGALALLNAQRFDWSSDSFRGDVLLLANCTSYSFYLVLSRPILAHYRVVTFTAAVFRYGAILITLLAVPELLRFHPSRRRPGRVGVPGRRRAASARSSRTCSTPGRWRAPTRRRWPSTSSCSRLISTVLAIAILGEALTARTVFAALLIFGGPRRDARARPPAGAPSSLTARGGAPPQSTPADDRKRSSASTIVRRHLARGAPRRR